MCQARRRTAESSVAGPGRILRLVVTGAVLAACGAAGASSVTARNVRIGVPAGPNAAAFMVLDNAGDAPARLVGADTDAARQVQIHETRTDGDQVTMVPLGGIDVPAGGAATLQPGGAHLMLIDVTGLAEGDVVPLTLRFDGAEDLLVDATVVAPADLGGGSTSPRARAVDAAAARHGG